ncbi:uncharacterized protein LOC117329061 [Pecten maximus]|uniref:uncharacterized protein LOC117329061 n=1 Tax=Pecten maximus TaxID=6579 RepID=UPI0014581E79|nr:uncharacterized protein LOC117329061 [Pecten maximus]
MGAICSSKSTTVVDSRQPATDESDSAVYTYANHNTSRVERRSPDVGERVGYINTSETLLQEDKNLPRGLSDPNMPARLPTGDATVPSTIDASSSKTKPDNPRMQTTFTNLKNAQQLFVTEMKNENTATEFDGVQKVLKRDVSDVFDEYTSPSERETIGDFMVEIGLVETLVKLYEYIIEDMYDAFTLATSMDSGKEKHLLKEIRKILWNFSDRSLEFKDAIAKTRIMFGFLAKDLQEMRKHEFNQIQENSFPFGSAVNIIHNCSRSSNITKDMYMVDPQPDGGETVSLKTCLQPFLHSSDTYVKLITLLSLAHMMDDKESKELLETDETILNFLLEMIRKATESENRRQQGFSVEELLDGLSRIAKNDSNKVKIMKIHDAFTLIKEIIIRGNVVSETTAAVRTIWELAFDTNTRGQIRQSEDLMKKLKELKLSGTAELANTASYAYFVITDSDDTESEDDELRHNTSDSMVPPEETDRSKNPLKSHAPPHSTIAAGETRPGHIMLSYNWTHQPMLLKVYDNLTEHGLPVWMDVYNMKGNLLDAMSQAIKDSDIVVICVSEQYGKSGNCRTEAEFARKKKKTIIPFMMQRNVDLPGWLDMLLGEKLYYKFYDFELGDQRAFDARMGEVIAALVGHMTPNQSSVQPSLLPSPDRKVDEPQTTVVKQKKSQETTTKAPKAKKSKQLKENDSPLDSWTEDDKDNWLRDNRLNTYKGMKAITCEQLQFLVKISVKAPEFFYRSLKEEVGLNGLEQLMRVSNAIEELV